MKINKIIVFVLIILMSGSCLTACKKKHTHKFGNWVEEVPATCTENGILGHKTCKRCGKYFDLNDNEIADIVIKTKGHSYSEEWSSNSSYHWKAAVCEHTDEIKEKEFHTFEEIGDEYKCSKCGYIGKKPTENLEYFYNVDTDGYFCGNGFPLSNEELSNFEGDMVIASFYDDGVHGLKPVTGIGSHAFRDFRFKSLEIPETVTVVENSAFRNCEKMSSVIIHEGLISIGGYAFGNCISLTSVVLPNSVEYISSQAFSDCISLSSVNIPNSLKAIGASAFSFTAMPFIEYKNGYYWGNEQNEHYILLNLIDDEVENFEIHEDTVFIADGALVYADSLTEIEIPENVINIGDIAFAYCTNLQNVKFKNAKVKYIGEEAFSKCTSLQNLDIPEGVEVIGKKIFAYDSSIEYIILPKTLKTIGQNVFYEVVGNNLKNVLYKGSKEDWQLVKLDGDNEYLIEKLYFYSETKPTEEGNYWHYGDGLILYWTSCEIDGHKFENQVYEPTCNEDGYTKHTCTECNYTYNDSYIDKKGHIFGNPIDKQEATCTEDGFEKHYQCSDCGTYFTEDKIGTKLENLVINKKGHNYIDDHTYKHTCSNCGDVLNVLEISEDGTTVTGVTEYGATVKYIQIPEGVTTIGRDCFYNAFYELNIDSLELPTTLTMIEFYAFYGVNVSKLYIKDIEKYYNISLEPYSNPVNSDTELYLNGQLVESLILPDSITSISPLVRCKSIKTITLGKGFSSLGVSCSFDCFPDLTTVIFSETISYVGGETFFWLDKLEKLVVNNPSIFFDMFSILNCFNLKTIEFIGTVEQWLECFDREAFASVSSDFVVICSNGRCDVNGDLR